MALSPYPWPFTIQFTKRPPTHAIFYWALTLPVSPRSLTASAPFNLPHPLFPLSLSPFRSFSSLFSLSSWITPFCFLPYLISPFVLLLPLFFLFLYCISHSLLSDLSPLFSPSLHRLLPPVFSLIFSYLSLWSLTSTVSSLNLYLTLLSVLVLIFPPSFHLSLLQFASFYLSPSLPLV